MVIPCHRRPRLGSQRLYSCTCQHVGYPPAIKLRENGSERQLQITCNSQVQLALKSFNMESTEISGHRSHALISETKTDVCSTIQYLRCQ